MNYRKHIIEKQLFALFQQASIGIEKEGQRLTLTGELSQNPHPERFGDRSFHPYIQTDYAESQLELITPVCRSVEEALTWLSAIHEVTIKQMDSNEVIWPMSMLLQLPEDAQITEAQMGEENTAYRQYLTQKYGKQKQMVSGIHYNFGFVKSFIDALYGGKASIAQQNDVYMKLSRQFIRYQWLLVYLFGSAIDTPEAYFKENEKPTNFVRSLRTSRYGYVNPSHIVVPYTSIEDYAQAITGYVKSGDLIAEKEFYSSVRFRGQQSVVDFNEKGIKYVEFRLFDINPFSPVGITRDDARFIQLFILLMLWLDEENATESVSLGQKMSEVIALQHPLQAVQYLSEGKKLFQELVELIEVCHFSQDDKRIVLERLQWLENPSQTISGQLVAKAQEGLFEFGLAKATEYKAHFMQRPFGIQAFSHMELSTQALMEDAIINGLAIEILDDKDQFLKLSHKGHEEYVKNGNMTQLDNYISPLMMANKVVTKKVLDKAGFHVPASVEVQTMNQAEQVYPLVSNKAIVIKPKSTNFGIGITIFKEPHFSKQDFLHAVEIALREDVDVMIEDYISGTEYRFFVIDDETKAVLLRVGAHVIGDGVHTIAQLVEMKNANALRGDGSKTPLKKIKIGDIELLQLKEQGYTPDSIVEKGVTVQLRANSNISTGGDSIDMTDDMHPSYKEIAVGIAKAMFAKVCGVDLIIPDYTKDAFGDVSETENGYYYGVIEANFNPMMMMHIYPAVGQSRRLTLPILQLLFPEMDIK